VSEQTDERAPGLRVEQLRKSFATPEGTTVHALAGVSLDIRPGEFFVMLGPSGCGKTTLLRSIAGLETADEGRILLDGERIDELPPYKRPVNTVFQSYALFPHLTVAKNIAFGLEMDGVSKADIHAKVTEMLALVHLPGLEGRRPGQLSGGQQQRVALARALAKRPKVLLLDEPLAALDLKLRRGMQAELKELQRTTGITFVFVTHDQEEALSMGDRIAVFENGRVAQVGTPQDIYERPVDRFVADFIGETNFFDVVLVRDGDTLAFALPEGPGVRLPADADHAIGHATVAVRPERVTFAPEGDADGAPATVTSATYMGTDLRATALLRDGTPVSTRVPASVESGHVRPGAVVSVRVTAGFARPVVETPTASEVADSADTALADAS
jgi:spermidine/putrescine transport system ATP-binding protein